MYYNKVEKDNITLLVTGDILLSRNVKVEIEKKNISPWHLLQQKFNNADILIGNLEGAIGRKTRIDSSVNPSLEFIVPTKYGTLLKDAGFDVLVTENNHSGDLFKVGIDSTETILKKNKIRQLNFQNSPQFFQKGDKIISMIALNQIMGKDSVVQNIPSAEVLQKIRLAKSLSQLVIVYIHWGNELNSWHNKTQAKVADWLTRNGVDLIVGTHPHVIQEPNLVNEKPVFYSLGNHLFDQKYLETKTGLLLECKVYKKHFECNSIKTKVDKESFFPKINSEITKLFSTTPLKPSKKTNQISLNINIDKTILNEKIILDGYQNESKVWSSLPIKMESLEFFHTNDKGDCLLSLEKHFSSLDKQISLRPYVYTATKKELMTLWRGSALAFPLIDATFLPQNQEILCALHQNRSYLQLKKASFSTKVVAYTWNGFGFKGVEDSLICRECEMHFNYLYNLK